MTIQSVKSSSKYAILAVGFSRDVGEGDKKEQLHWTTMEAEERKEKQNNISISRKFGC